MKFNLLDNGVDSLKATYDSLDHLSYLQEGIEHHVKDAIISLNHANEILFKLLLKEQNEFLIFSDLAAFMNAKELMIKSKKPTVFAVKPNIQTVSFTEAIRRLELLCNIPIPKDLQTSLKYLNKKRNEIMHYEIEMTDGELKSCISKLKTCYEHSITFFSNYYPELENMIDEARFEYTEDPDVEAMVDEAYIDFLESQE